MELPRLIESWLIDNKPSLHMLHRADDESLICIDTPKGEKIVGWVYEGTIEVGGTLAAYTYGEDRVHLIWETRLKVDHISDPKFFERFSVGLDNAAKQLLDYAK